MCRAELLFYYVPYVLLLPEIKRYNCSLDFEKHKGLLGTFLKPSDFRTTFSGKLEERFSSFCICWLFGEGIVQRNTEGTEPFLKLYTFPREGRSKVCRWFKMFRANLCICASRNLKNNCNILLRAIKVHKERSKIAARLFTQF